MKLIDSVLKLTRIPMAFTQTIFIVLGFIAANGSDYVRLLLGVLILGPTLIYGGIYVLNDIVDREQDKMHPKKRMRPLPAGDVGAGFASTLAVVLLVTGYGAAYLLLGGLFFMISIVILVNNLTYFLYPRLKDRLYLGMLSCSLNYPLRFLAGASLAATTIDDPVTALAGLFLILALEGFISYRIYDAVNSKKPNRVDNSRLSTVVRVLNALAATTILAMTLWLNVLSGIVFCLVLMVYSETHLGLASQGVDFFKLLRPWHTLKRERHYWYYPALALLLALSAVNFIANI